MRRVLGAILLTTVALRPGAAHGQTPLPTMTLVDENVCWLDWGCSNWLWSWIQLPEDRGRPNPVAVIACAASLPVGNDLQSCVADLTGRTGAPSYPVCLWAVAAPDAPPGHFPECPAYSSAEFREHYPNLSQLEWCGSSGCRPPGMWREIRNYYQSQEAR